MILLMMAGLDMMYWYGSFSPRFDPPSGHLWTCEGLLTPCRPAVTLRGQRPVFLLAFRPWQLGIRVSHQSWGLGQRSVTPLAFNPDGLDEKWKWRQRSTERHLWITKIKRQLLIFTNTNAYQSLHTWVWWDSVIATHRSSLCVNNKA